MILFPAIDIRNGNCVRLIQGDYDKEKVYSNSPLEMALTWEKKGAQGLHLVDLDGAKTGEATNKEIIIDIAKNVTIPVQVGGGVRSFEQVESYLSNGISRVIFGTAAIENPTLLQKAVTSYQDKIAVSIDARNGYVATNGWKNTSKIQAIDLLKELEEIGVKTIIYTDIFKDGMLQGPNFEELQVMNDASSIQVIASGGITNTNDVDTLKSMNLYGAIIGKALYDGSIFLETLLEGDKNAR
ncbi:1-(5-phosphoribosyl)-5-[(5-phosphoribosylamino)methylideneamino]imidazole-4-carboxamide isomerase [Ornithinibacillus halophilus]|uniref:1-(5-phosphoribosyl)-5-[(5-phosphoribosylamino)methylideneamino] imidazole-4-carboxamide isomerase n=1 Tax=Ornithinibacillus halophilus TaxID=930117 RepID=A0A1M5H1B3_9BACI|nr:1-(5-phosphoribosyl)-5-[(5-phosphoribosylamino)methylideneamino]imidazole-4-carboxamide isomerase [Ornithinibacillus halophilus]SHG09512.1 1-(5-phosphoribosyl)-5-[(5-phosphoribosylamino)methylideneamino] imidazole-4-carboxamide isomerase [Ornithinibacillus halophilus]